MDEFQALATSIGEYTVANLGKGNLRGLRLMLDTRTLSGHLFISLKDNSDAAQLRALKELFEVERVFEDDAVLIYQFVDDVHSVAIAEASVPQFSYA